MLLACKQRVIVASPAHTNSCADLYCLFLRQPIAMCDFPAFRGKGGGPTLSGSAQAHLCSEKNDRISYQVRTNPNTSKNNYYKLLDNPS